MLQSTLQSVRLGEVFLLYKFQYARPARGRVTGRRTCGAPKSQSVIARSWHLQAEETKG